MFQGNRDKVPDGCNALVEFVYVENAAAMHVRCLHALLEEEDGEGAVVSGKAFNITNGDESREAIVVWNELITKINNNNNFGAVIPTMKSIPYVVMYSIACVTEAIFALTCGHVPWKRNPIWNLTRGSLALSCTTVTQDMKATNKLLLFNPKYTTTSSFDEMVAEAAAAAAAAAAAVKTANATSTSIDPLDKISWDPPLGVSFQNVNIFDRMSGPGMTNQEAGITSLGMVFGMMYAYWQRIPEWSNVQLVMSLFFALINASAVAQCTTPSSKRWYHMNGRLPDYLAYTIAVEVVVLVIILHATFGDGGNGGLHAAFGRNALTEAAGLSFAVLITHYSPLPIQRAVGVMCMCTGFALLQANESLCSSEANCPGMEWCIPLLLVKYCISHVPRHEPYV